MIDFRNNTSKLVLHPVGHPFVTVHAVHVGQYGHEYSAEIRKFAGIRTTKVWLKERMASGKKEKTGEEGVVSTKLKRSMPRGKIGA